MPHIEEGELHALLDGAYAHDGPAAARIREEIASCAECRARFDEAQAMRMRASAILGRALPNTTAPPFDTVLQRAEIADAPRRFRFPTGARLAWAATIVLALGIGWFVRDGLYEAKESPRAELDAAARAKNEPATQPGAPPAVAPAEATPPAPTPQRANTRALQPRAVPPSAGAGAGAADKRVAAAEANVREERADKFAERKLAEGSEKAKVRDENQRRSENAVMQSAAQPDSARLRFAQSAQKAAPQAAPQPPKQEAAASRAALAQLDSAWQYVTLEEAERVTGRRVLRIPGLELVNVGVSGSTGRYVTRATQRLPDGSMIEIVQQATPEASQLAGGRNANAAAEPTPPSAKDATGATVLQLARNGWLLTGRGTMSVDSLRVLLNSVR